LVLVLVGVLLLVVLVVVLVVVVVLLVLSVGRRRRLRRGVVRVRGLTVESPSSTEDGSCGHLQNRTCHPCRPH
jgi:hypothetical protein